MQIQTGKSIYFYVFLETDFNNLKKQISIETLCQKIGK
jgi:hypothetical protein